MKKVRRTVWPVLAVLLALSLLISSVAYAAPLAIQVEASNSMVYNYDYTALGSSQALANHFRNAFSWAFANGKKVAIDDTAGVRVDFESTFDHGGYAGAVEAVKNGQVPPAGPLAPTHNIIVDNSGNVVAQPVGAELRVVSISAINGTEVIVKLSNIPAELPSASSFQVSDSNGRTYAVTSIAAEATPGEYKLTLGTPVEGKGTLTVKYGNSQASKEFDTTSQGLKLEMSISKDTLTADGADNAIVTVRVLRNGVLDPSFEGTVKFISLKGATFAKQLVAFDKGVASVQLTAMSSAVPITDTIEAIIADATDSQFVGTSAQINVAYVPATAGGTTGEKVFITYAESDRASDVFVKFNKPFDFAKLYDQWAATPKKAVFNVTSNGASVSIAGLEKVDDTTVKLVLVEPNKLIDNSQVIVTADDNSYIDSILIDSQVTFNLVDSKAPEAVSVETPDYRTIVAKFTEPVSASSAEVVGNWVLNGHQLNSADVEFIKVGRDVVDNGVIQSTDINPYVPDKNNPVDNRNYVTIQLKPDPDPSDSNKIGLAWLKPAGEQNLLQAYNIIDYAGLTDTTGQNKATTQEFTFVTPAPPSAPTADMIMQSPEQFKVNFSSAVQHLGGGDLNASDFKFEYQNGTNADGTPNWVEVPLEDTVTHAIYGVVSKLSSNQYLIELEEDWTVRLNTAGTGHNYYTPNYNKVRITVKKDNVYNLAGVQMAADATRILTMTLDATSPTISKAEQLFDASGNPLQEFRVQMSEPVQMLTATTNASGGDATVSRSVYGYDTNVLTPSQTQQAGTGVPTPTFQFVNADGSKTVDGELSGAINQEDTVFTVKPKSSLDAGNWTIYIRSISDDVGNTSATVSYPLVVQGVTEQGEPVIIWADAHDNQWSVTDSVYHDVVHIQFGTVMSQDVLKSSVYTINGKALPPGAMVTTEDVKYNGDIVGTRVTITLPYTFLGEITEKPVAVDPNEPNILNVSTSLKDAKGNPIKPPTEVQLTYNKSLIPPH